MTNKEEETFGASGTGIGAGAGVVVDVEGGTPKEPESVAMVKGLLNAAVLTKKFGIPEAVVVATAGAGVCVSDFGGCGVGGASEIVGTAGAAGAGGFDDETGSATDAGADSFDNENGSALMGGSFAFVTSWGIGVCDNDETMYP